MWNVRTRKLVTVLVGHLTAVTSAAFSRDGRWIVTAGKDGSARIWGYPSGVQRAELLGHSASLSGAEFDPTGAALVLTSSADGTARTWDAVINPPMKRFAQLGRPVESLAYSPDGSLLASRPRRKGALVENLGSTAAARDLVRRAARCRGVQLRWQLVAASGRRVAFVWRVANGARVARLSQPGEVRAVAFSPDGTHLATSARTASPLSGPFTGAAPWVSTTERGDGRRLQPAWRPYRDGRSERGHPSMVARWTAGADV